MSLFKGPYKALASYYGGTQMNEEGDSAAASYCTGSSGESSCCIWSYFHPTTYIEMHRRILKSLLCWSKPDY